MKKFFSILSGALLLSAAATASAAVDRTPSSTSPPIISWQPPASYKAPSSGRTALTDLSQPMPFVPVTPCRQYDSRNSTVLADNTPRTVTLTGAPCGIPASAKAVAVNITVFNITGAGSNGVFKVGISAPPPTSWINYPFSETQRANAGTLGLTGAGAIVVQVNQGAGSVDFLVDVFGWYGDTTTSGEFRVINAAASGWGVLGEETGINGIGVYGFTSADGGRGVFGANASTTGIITGVHGQIAGAGSFGSAAVKGTVLGITLTGTPGFSVTPGGLFTGDRGILGYCPNAGGGGVIGAESNAAGTGNQEWGGLAVNGFSVYGSNNGSIGGNFSVTGTLSKGAGSFKIDHPLDPENKYLYHSFVESPDMMNVYNGNIVLNSRGEATVVLPDWFEVLNRDFRYHLTAIGQPSPNLFIAREVEGNEFQIAGGRPGTKVSWTVTGIRHDRFAEANRIPGEVMKAENERGLYLHPEAFGKPASQSIESLRAGPVAKEIREYMEREQQPR